MHHFVDADASAVSVLALAVYFRLVERDFIPACPLVDGILPLQDFQYEIEIHGVPQFFEFLFGKEILLLVAAELSYQALRDDDPQRRDQEECFSLHVEKARDRSGGGVGVERREHEMPRERRVYRESRGLVVADLADHDDVRVLAHERAQTVSEREADVGAHLCLIDARHLVFDRVLDGRDVDAGRVQEIKHGVERRRLSASGGTGREDESGGFLDRLVKRFKSVAVESQSLECEPCAPFAQKAHHGLLAEIGRERRDTERHFLSVRIELEASVLRKALLIELHAGENFDAGGDGRGGGLGKRHRVVEDAVDAIAHQKLVLLRLDVDIGCVLRDRVL